MSIPPVEVCSIALWHRVCRVLRIGVIAGLFLYYCVIPIEFLVTDEYKVTNDFLKIELPKRSLIDGPLLALLAFFGFFLGTQSLMRTQLNFKIHLSKAGESAAQVATLLLVGVIVLTPFTGILNSTASSEDAVMIVNSSRLVAINSLLLTATAATSAAAMTLYFFNSATRRKSAWWLLWAAAISFLGMKIGDKDQVGAVALVCIASLALRLRGKVLSTMVACLLCVAGLFAVPSSSLFKFSLHGIEPDFSRFLVLPSSSDPGGAFAIMSTAMDQDAPLGNPDYSALNSISDDLLSFLPGWIYPERPADPGTSIAKFLIGPKYVKGYGVGYSPYVDFYCALGLIGPVLIGMLIGGLITILLRLAKRADSSGGLVVVCGLVTFTVLVVGQRLSMMGAVKQLLYYNGILISAYIAMATYSQAKRKIRLA